MSVMFRKSPRNLKKIKKIVMMKTVKITQAINQTMKNRMIPIKTMTKAMTKKIKKKRKKKKQKENKKPNQKRNEDPKVKPKKAFQNNNTVKHKTEDKASPANEFSKSLPLSFIKMVKNIFK